MKLKEFFDETGMPHTVFADRAKVSRPTVLKAVKGLYITFRSAEKIVAATKGKVTIQELMPTTSTTQPDHPV